MYSRLIRAHAIGICKFRSRYRWTPEMKARRREEMKGKKTTSGRDHWACFHAVVTCVELTLGVCVFEIYSLCESEACVVCHARLQRCFSDVHLLDPTIKLSRVNVTCTLVRVSS